MKCVLCGVDDFTSLSPLFEVPPGTETWMLPQKWGKAGMSRCLGFGV